MAVSVSSQPKKSGQCAYCGKKQPVTDDHIPPRNLFPKPRGSNLITVPCCEFCRKGWSEDDEYFRAAILCSARVSEQTLAKSPLNSFFRSLDRSEHRKFARMIYESIDEFEIFTKGGIYLGNKPGFRIQKERIDRVTQRIIRGLFFHEKRYPVPEGYEVIAEVLQFGLEPILECFPGVRFPEPQIIQDGVFCYTFKETQQDPDSIIWLLLFYENLPMVGFTRVPPELRATKQTDCHNSC